MHGINAETDWHTSGKCLATTLIKELHHMQSYSMLSCFSSLTYRVFHWSLYALLQCTCSLAKKLGNPPNYSRWIVLVANMACTWGKNTWSFVSGNSNCFPFCWALLNYSFNDMSNVYKIFLNLRVIDLGWQYFNWCS